MKHEGWNGEIYTVARRPVPRPRSLFDKVFVAAAAAPSPLLQRNLVGTTPNSPGDAARTLHVVRAALLGLVVLGLVGTGIELVLLEHTEEAVQWSPIALTGIALAVIVWQLLAPSRWSVRTLQVTMTLLIIAGIVGTILHYRGNVEFELEMHPDVGGLALFRDAMMGATPALSPGAMVLLGALGLLYAFRHPALAR